MRIVLFVPTMDVPPKNFRSHLLRFGSICAYLLIRVDLAWLSDLFLHVEWSNTRAAQRICWAVEGRPVILLPVSAFLAESRTSLWKTSILGSPF